MNRITVHDPLNTELARLAEPAEVVDETGRRLGHFVPALATMDSGDCPYSGEELERMRREEGGHPLGEIWKSLGAK